MYRLILLCMLSFLFGPKALDAQTKTIYDFKVTALEGGTIDFSKYKGKKDPDRQYGF